LVAFNDIDAATCNEKAVGIAVVKLNDAVVGLGLDVQLNALLDYQDRLNFGGGGGSRKGFRLEPLD
jgi:hypothetical protein